MAYVSCVFFLSPACAGEADITFILDSSGSIGNEWSKVRNFVASVVENMYISESGVHVAIILFSAKAEISIKLNSHYRKSDILDAIYRLPFQEGSGTNTTGALLTMMNEVYTQRMGNRLHVRDIAIVMTDGQSTIERDLTVPTAKKAHELGIRTFAIGVGSADLPEFKAEIDGIASDPDDDHVFSIGDFGDLEFIEDTLVKRTCREAPPSKYQSIITFLTKRIVPLESTSCTYALQ